MIATTSNIIREASLSNCAMTTLLGKTINYSSTNHIMVNPFILPAVQYTNQLIQFQFFAN